MVKLLSFLFFIRYCVDDVHGLADGVRENGGFADGVPLFRDGAIDGVFERVAQALVRDVCVFLCLLWWHQALQRWRTS